MLCQQDHLLRCLRIEERRHPQLRDGHGSTEIHKPVPPLAVEQCTTHGLSSFTLTHHVTSIQRLSLAPAPMCSVQIMCVGVAVGVVRWAPVKQTGALASSGGDFGKQVSATLTLRRPLRRNDLVDIVSGYRTAIVQFDEMLNVLKKTATRRLIEAVYQGVGL